MDQTHSYNGSLTAEQFLFYEIRIASRFYLEGKTIEEAPKPNISLEWKTALLLPSVKLK